MQSPVDFQPGMPVRLRAGGQIEMVVVRETLLSEESQALGVVVAWRVGDREVQAVFPGDALEAVPESPGLSGGTRAALVAALDGDSCERAISHFCSRKEPAA